MINNLNLLQGLLETQRNLAIVNNLNALLKIDPNLIGVLVDTRYPVSEEYKKSSFVYTEEGAGLIGVLSGLCLNTNKFRFSANYDENEVLVSFSLLEVKEDGKFVEVKPIA